jgi:hypothetical protein
LGIPAICPKRLINFCWCWFKWGLILCVIGAALLVPYFYNRIDESICNCVQKLIAGQYPGLQVKIHSAVLMKGEGIVIRGLSIIDPATAGPGAELFSYDECTIDCPTNLSDLLSGQIQPARVVIRRAMLRMTRRPDGGWSTSRLLPIPKLGEGPPPEVRFENGTLEIFDPTKPVGGTLTLRDVNLTLAPIASPNGTAEPTRRKRIQGTATGDYFRQVALEGEVDPDRPALKLSGKIEGVEISPDMRSLVPEEYKSNISMLGSLRGQTEARFQVSYNPAAAEPWTFNVTGHLTRGRIDDGRLPRPLTEVSATVHVDNRGFAIEQFKARSNQATLSLKCSGGLRPSSPMSLEAEVDQLPLDEQLLASLPGNLQAEWQKLRPEGLIDAKVKLRYDGRTWEPELSIECRGVSFTHYKFPYRLEHGRGMLDLKDDCLKMNLSTFSENKLVQILGELHHPMDGPTGWMQIACNELPIDEKLLQALPAASQSLVHSLDLKGTIGFEFELSREIAGGPEHQHLTLVASNCSLRYVRFPYPISKARGEIEMIDGNWWFRNLEGYDGTTRVTGEGTLMCTPRVHEPGADGITEALPGGALAPQGNELLLRLSADRVPLERDLHDALQPGMKEVWALLQPQGVIDITASIHFLDRLNLLDVTVRAQPRSETCSIEPVQFPYRIENVQGVFTYGSGRLTFENFSGWHGPVKISCNGICSFQTNGGWQLRLDRLTVDRLRMDMDRQFVQALPPQLKKGLAELNVTGRMSLQGNLLMARGASPAEPMTSQWNLNVGLNQVGFDCGKRLENAYGSVGVAGWSDGTRFQMRGELALDSLTCHDRQFTQVLGPIWIDERQALFGGQVAKRDNSLLPPGQPAAPLRPITAKIFGGTVYGDGWVLFGPQLRYGLQANLIDADLATFARETTGNDRNLRGRIRGSVDLGGTGRNRRALVGRGWVQLHDANIYELPDMVRMLKILSIKAPDANAFSKSDMFFRIENEQVYFDKLDFNGDAISLLGKGEISFEGDTHMVFTAVVGRADTGVPILRNIFTGASQQFMQIRATGKLQDLNITREAFPGVNQALKNLQEDPNR